MDEVGPPVTIYSYDDDVPYCIWYLAVACEVLARRIVHLAPPDRLHSLMSTRFKHRQLDGDISEMSSALEMAIDSHW